MTGVVFGMAGAIVVLVGLLALAGARIERLQEDETSAHAKCIAHVADMTSKRVVAMALREYARQWDSVENRHELTLLGRTYKADGPTVPARWMTARAEELES